jgi:hypothetical protein
VQVSYASAVRRVCGLLILLRVNPRLGTSDEGVSGIPFLTLPLAGLMMQKIFIHFTEINQLISYSETRYSCVCTRVWGSLVVLYEN